jgi:hypothetical protein
VREINGEVTHNAPKSVDFGTVHFNFLWTAPDELGKYVLYGAGNSVNLDGGTGNDIVVTDTIEIWVENPSTPGAPTATSTTAPTSGTPTTPPPTSPTATETPTALATTPTTPGPSHTPTPSASPTPGPAGIYLPVALASWQID